jgi:hypothetical protein
VIEVTLKNPPLYLIFAGILLFLAGCAEPPDEEQVLRQHMKKIEQAAERKLSGDILAYLAEDFLGNDQFRKANIKGMLFVHFRRNKNVHVFLHDVGIEVLADKAMVKCQVILAGREENIMPERARILEITSQWQKRDGDWQVVSASWKDPYYEYLNQ